MFLPTRQLERSAKTSTEFEFDVIEPEAA